MESRQAILWIFSAVVFLSITIKAHPYEGLERFNALRVVREADSSEGSSSNDDSESEGSNNDNNSDDNSAVRQHPVTESKGRNIYLPDNRIGERVSNWNKSMKMNPEELGSYFEGDILQPVGTKRNGIINLNDRWPGGVIPYWIGGSFTAQQRQLIINAMEDYHRYTCIRFRPWNRNDRDYINILSANSGCWSSVGRVGGAQQVNLQAPGCVYEKGTVVHELMHATGFWHEQSRADRDTYVAIQWNNIENGQQHNFDIEKQSDPRGTPYDYHSVMHYSSHAFSKNQNPTIVPRYRVQGELGQRVGFSQNDVTKINRLYGCVTGRR